MKSPFTGKEMKVVKEWRDMTFRKEVFPVLFHYYVCEETGEQFEDENFAELNYNQVINQYRAKHHIPFPEQISEIRAKYELSAAKMSEILGLGVNSWRNYEAGEVPSKAIANSIQMINDPEYFLKIIIKCSELEEKERDKILKHIRRLIENLDWLGNPLYCFDSEPDITTGFKPFNQQKTRQVIIFFAQRQQPYKTKMNKLMFYTDFAHFRSTGQGVTGLRYAAIDFGPVPNDYEILFNRLRAEEIIDVESTMTENGELERFLPASGIEFDPSIFSPAEIETLEYIAQRFKDASASLIADISHNEPAWKENIEGKRIISYNYSYDLEAV